MDLDLELTPHHLRWDICGTDVGDGVDPLKVQPNYESGYGSGDGIDPPKIDFTLVF